MDKKKDRRPPQISLILRIGCGAYLLYLAWGLIGSALAGEQLLFGIVGAVFALAGLPLCVLSLRALVRGEFRLPYEQDHEDEERDEESL